MILIYIVSKPYPNNTTDLHSLGNLKSIIYNTRSCTHVGNYNRTFSTCMTQSNLPVYGNGEVHLKPQCHTACAWEELGWQCPESSTAGDDRLRACPRRWTRLQDSCASTRTQRQARLGLACFEGCGKGRWRGQGLPSSHSWIWSVACSGQCQAEHWTASDWTLELRQAPNLLPYITVRNQRPTPCSWTSWPQKADPGLPARNLRSSPCHSDTCNPQIQD